jgi:ankyrin repeat protein
VIDFLLGQGADVVAENNKKNSASDLFWRAVLSNRLSEPVQLRLAERFIDRSYVENAGFTSVHKIILGLTQIDLDQMLADSPHLINQPDAYGQTPLHWAATRGDEDAVATLLNHGADVHAMERGGSTPLIWGIASRNTRVTIRLLEGGSDPDHSSKIWLDRAIHIACHEALMHQQARTFETHLWNLQLRAILSRRSKPCLQPRYLRNIQKLWSLQSNATRYGASVRC